MDCLKHIVERPPPADEVADQESQRHRHGNRRQHPADHPAKTVLFEQNRLISNLEDGGTGARFPCTFEFHRFQLFPAHAAYLLKHQKENDPYGQAGEHEPCRRMNRR